MNKINLNFGYYIEIDPLNYTLKQEYTAKRGKNKGQKTTRVVGYFGDIRKLMYKYLGQCQIEYESPDGIEMLQYVKMVEKSNKRAVEGLHEALGRFPVN